MKDSSDCIEMLVDDLQIHQTEKKVRQSKNKMDDRIAFSGKIIKFSNALEFARKYFLAY
jgi:hypothetical protein